MDFFIKFYYLSGLSHVWPKLDNANTETVKAFSDNYATISTLNDDKMQKSSLNAIAQLVKDLQEEADSVDNLLRETNQKLHEIINTSSG
jgi:hypothetical protein